MAPKKIIALFNQKGGVGKSTTSANLAVILSTLGLRVLLIDLDAQGNSTRNLHVVNAPLCGSYDVLTGKATINEAAVQTRFPGLWAVCATTQLASLDAEIALSQDGGGVLGDSLNRALADVGEIGEIVLIDCPPAFGVTTINALTCAHQVILPVKPETFAYDGLTRTMRTLKRIQGDLNANLQEMSILLTMTADLTDAKGGEAEEPLAQTIRTEYHPDVFPGSIRLDPTVPAASALDVPAAVLNPDAPASMDYLRLCVLVLEASTKEAIPPADLDKLYTLTKEKLTALHEKLKEDGDLGDLPGFTSQAAEGPDGYKGWSKASDPQALSPEQPFPTKIAIACTVLGLMAGLGIGVLVG
jgi:chromosome partitioning protein